MPIVKCDKGHYYDNVKYEECPHCKGGAEKSHAEEENEKTVAKISSDKIKKNLAAFAAGGDERTISIFSSKGHFVPVVGWLVCTDGVEKGRDYRLVSGRNFIGRAYQMDVSIPDDKGISRENHCSVVYDPKTKKFCLVPGENVVFYNGEKITQPVDIEKYGEIKLGNTVLRFIPYCKEGVEW